MLFARLLFFKTHSIASSDRFRHVLRKFILHLLYFNKINCSFNKTAQLCGLLFYYREGAGYQANFPAYPAYRQATGRPADGFSKQWSRFIYFREGALILFLDFFKISKEENEMTSFFKVTSILAVRPDCEVVSWRAKGSRTYL